MLKLIVISDCKDCGQAIRKIVERLFGNMIYPYSGIESNNLPLYLIKSKFEILDADFAIKRQSDYFNLVEIIENSIGHPEENSHSLIVLVCIQSMDSFRDINPLKIEPSPSQLIGMLMLTFPEVEWVVTNGGGLSFSSEWIQENEPDFIASVHKAIHRMHAGFTPLFDARGLRNKIYKFMKDEDDRVSYLPLREPFAAAVDEEVRYSYFNAYIGYKFGFRSVPVHTEKMMELLDDSTQLKQNKVDLVFEDVFLNFSDKTNSEQHFSNFENRDNKFSWLKDALFRVVISVGGGTETEISTRKNNDNYFISNGRFQWDKIRCDKSSDDNIDQKWWSQVDKPVSGIFTIFNNSGAQEWRKQRWGQFEWPSPSKMDETKNQNSGHSCEGILLLVATQLIRRAKRLQKDAPTAIEAVRGAVFSNIAFELLGGKTPTLAEEALGLKHHFEVLAECQFYGVQAHIDLNYRLIDIENDIELIGQCFSNEKNQRKKAVLNGKVGIVDNLITLFREQNQFDEEMILLNESRSLHRHIKYWDSPTFGNYFRRLTSGYLNFIMSSFANLSIAIFGWIIFFAGVFLCFTELSVGQSFLDGIMTFIGQPPMKMNPSEVNPLKDVMTVDLLTSLQEIALLHPDKVDSNSTLELFKILKGSVQNGPQLIQQSEPNLYANGMIVLGMIVGLFHIGVFLSYLYSIVLRR